MKAFIISLSLTLALIIAVIVNAGYVLRTTEQMKSLVRQIEQNVSDDKAFEDLDDIWERHKIWFALSVGLGEIDRVTEYITRLGCAIENGNAIDAERNCALLQIFFDDVSRHEKISLLNIF